MATVDDDDVLDDDQLDVLLNFPPDIQEVIEQVFWVNIYLVEKKIIFYVISMKIYELSHSCLIYLYMK